MTNVAVEGPSCNI